MANDGMPKLELLITPRFDMHGQAVSLSISLTFDCPKLLKNSTLLTCPASLLDISDEFRLQASDETGQLLVILAPLEESSQPLGQEWRTGRETCGSIKARYEVLPSPEAEIKSNRPVIGLYQEPGGLLGSGFAVVPFLPIANIYTSTVKWMLKGAPKGTRAVWTYGEGPEPVERVGPVSMLRDSVFMVGQIRSHSPLIQSSTAGVNKGSKTSVGKVSTSDHYGYFWFGLLPPKVEIMKNIHYTCFTNAQKMFGPDDDSVEDFEHAFFANVPEADRKCIVNPLPYRSFVRNTGKTKAFGGISFGHSHIFNYDDQIDKAHGFDLMRRVAYEMAHIWFGPPALGNVHWLYKGIIDRLSIYIPVRYPGLNNDYYFNSTINMLCTRYYTSPLIEEPFGNILARAKTDTFAMEHISARAWAFVFGVDMQARILAKDKLKALYPVERIAIIALANHKARGGADPDKYWIKLLTPLMGEELQQRQDGFTSGIPIILSASFPDIKDHYFTPIQDNILDFGMDIESFSEGVVKGLQIGSRAWIAGLENGDKILWSSHMWRCVDSSDDRHSYMVLEIERNRKEAHVKYLPRSFDEVESWELRDMSNGELEAREESLNAMERRKKQEKMKLEKLTNSSNRKGKGKGKGKEGNMSQ